MSNEGWECPKCHVVWSPNVDRCKNCHGYQYTVTIPPYDGTVVWPPPNGNWPVIITSQIRDGVPSTPTINLGILS